MAHSEGPLLVFGPRSLTYDLGPGHPLTPRRFGPGIDLLRSVGAEPGLAPEPATNEELRWLHTAGYVSAVRRFGEDPGLPSAAGIGPGDTPAFHGMHEASAAVAGGSLRAMEAILRGDVEHAFHPGGGLHHAMPDHASGFCVYDDPALAIALARRAGLRVLYVDLDVHHGDGVQEMHLADPGVLTVSVHESGRYLFPGTGFPWELGEGEAAGTAVNVPLEPGTGGDAWLEAVRFIVPALAAAFGPDVVVSQHGADSHALDPLAHLWVTTTAMGEAARLVDSIAHGWAGGRWLSTGGGGYDVYRVVPRAWALTWLAGAHRDPPARVDESWRERWAAEAARHGQSPLPERFDDPPAMGRAGSAAEAEAAATSLATARLVRSVLVPRLVREAEQRGWWSSLDSAETDGVAGRTGGVGSAGVGSAGAGSAGTGSAGADSAGEPTILASLDASTLERLRLAPRVVAPADAAAARSLLVAALRSTSGVRITAAVAGDTVVGLAVSAPSAVGPGGSAGSPTRIVGSDGTIARPSGVPARSLLSLGVAPDRRRRGLGSSLLRTHVASIPEASIEALVTVAERDPLQPLPRAIRASIARRLLHGAGFRESTVPDGTSRIDPDVLLARRPEDRS